MINKNRISTLQLRESLHVILVFTLYIWEHKLSRKLVSRKQVLRQMYILTIIEGISLPPETYRKEAWCGFVCRIRLEVGMAVNL